MDTKLINIEALELAVADVRRHFPGAKPFGAFVLGSGWGDAIKIFKVKKEIAFSEINGFGSAGVVGHAGKLSLVEVDGKEMFVFQGRKHYYEGTGWTAVIMTAYISAKMGCKIFFASNAAGSPNFKPGNLMMITDHINFMSNHPLIGPHHPELGARFPDMTYAYDPGLIKVMDEIGKRVDVPLERGVYMAFSGPTYETPAEVRMAKMLGADAVGMSTVPEVIVANALGMRVAGVSCITNYAAGVLDQPLGHAEVVETLNATMGKIHKVLPEIVREFAKLAY